MLLEKLRLLEYSLHNDRRNDRAWLELILHPEFREITRTGVMVNRSETITVLLSEKAALCILSSDFRLMEIGCGCALLNYRTFYADGSHPALRSSYWICSDEGQWTLFFHQGTPAAGTDVQG
ncbi:nuclear transport factor 2 family protein [Pantoea vagans]|uniref:nuclear transport factor 2 family protein n=1 Tax=Pantoea vagans TaxID=470934 RepID=UPI003FA3D1F0